MSNENYTQIIQSSYFLEFAANNQEIIEKSMGVRIPVGTRVEKMFERAGLRVYINAHQNLIQVRSLITSVPFERVSELLEALKPNLVRDNEHMIEFFHFSYEDGQFNYFPKLFRLYYHLDKATSRHECFAVTKEELNGDVG